MASQPFERTRERVAALAGRGLDLVSFWTEVRDALGTIVPYHLTPCWYTLDPASLLITSHHDHGMIPEVSQEWLAHEYLRDDVLKLADVARAPSGVATLHEATDGDPSLSPGWDKFVRPYGGEQELLLALRTRSDEAWGMLALYRNAEQPPFDDRERAFLQALSRPLADGARRALLVGEAAEPEDTDGPGMVILSADLVLESSTPGADRWLAELPRGDAGLPAAVIAVAGRALQAADDVGPLDLEEAAFARVRTGGGTWLSLHGAVLTGDGDRRVSVIVEPAHPSRIASLIMAAHDLSERERDVARHVLQGHSTDEIAAALFLSPHTVQEHLKRIFDKTGVRSRRELTGKVFFTHYEPRLRDNERRALDGHPLRGGPARSEGSEWP